MKQKETLTLHVMVRAQYFNNFFSVHCYEFFRKNVIDHGVFYDHLPVFINRI